MIKKDLIDYISKTYALTKYESSLIISDIFDYIKRDIKAGNKVKIKDFGIFNYKISNPRVSRDPRNGSRVDVPSKKKVLFKVSSSLKKFINS